MTTYIHKKYFAVPHDANALTKMHLRQSNARNFGSEEQEVVLPNSKKYAIADTALFLVFPASFVGMAIGELLHRIS